MISQGIGTLRELLGLAKFPPYPWEHGRILCGKPWTEHDKVAQFQHKTGVTSAGFLAVFAQLFWATLRRLEQLVTDTEELRRGVVFPFEKTVTISAWAQMELNKSLFCARSSEPSFCFQWLRVKIQSAGGSKACLLRLAALWALLQQEILCMYIKDYFPCPLSISVLATKEAFT